MNSLKDRRSNRRGWCWTSESAALLPQIASWMPKSNSVCVAAPSLVDPRLAQRPCLPAPVNAKSLIKIKPHVLFDDAGEQLSQSPHVFGFVTRGVVNERLLNLEQKAPAFLVPWRKDREHQRPSAQGQLRQNERGRSRHAKKIDKDSFAIERVQIHQNPQRPAALEKLKHLSRG